MNLSLSHIPDHVKKIFMFMLFLVIILFPLRSGFAQTHEKILSKINTNIVQTIQQDMDTHAMTFVDIEENIKDYIPIPISIQSYGRMTHLKAKALYQENRVWVPVSVLQQVTLYRLEPKENHVILQAPLRKAAITGVSVVNYGEVHPILLPIHTHQNITYVMLPHDTSVMGISLQKNKENLIISSDISGNKKYQKADTSKHIAMVFDPFSKGNKAYDEPLILDNKVTNVISPSWFALDKKGLIVSPDVSESYITHYTSKGYRIWPLVSNQFNPALTHEIVTHPESWDMYVNLLADYALAYGYDGYNLDFENIDYEDKDDMTRFATYLAQELHHYGLFISMDVTGYSNSLRWSKVYNRKELAKAMDYIILMAYDQVGAKSQTSGPVATFPWVERNLVQILEEVPANQLILGIPFYMRDWMTTYKEGKKVAQSKTLSIAESLSLNSIMENKIWQDDNQLYYVHIPMHLGEREIWLEDINTLQAKLSLIKKYNLAGFAAWRKGFENPELWHSIRESFYIR